MQSQPVAAVRVLKIISGKNPSSPGSSEDLLAVEEPLEIRIIFGEEKNRQERNISVTMCTPGQEEELALGFLFTEGIIKHFEEVLSVAVPGNNPDRTVTLTLKPGIFFDPKKIERHFYTSSSCGVCGKSSIDSVRAIFPFATGSDSLRVHTDQMLQLPGILRNTQEIFNHTGGLHASALFDMDGQLLITREDVGRHNALDKLIGAMLKKGMLPLDQHILLLSGRASFELLQKAVMAGIKIIAAVGAPSSLAVSLAKETNTTLAGFLREGRFNIYSGEHRIVY